MKTFMTNVAAMLVEVWKWFYNLVKTEMGYGTWLVLGLCGVLMFARQIYAHFVNPSVWLFYDVTMFKAMAALAVYTIKNEVLKK